MSPDSIEAEASDAGRLWSVATPPLEQFEERYGVKADSAWARHLRRGVLRLPRCTAALISGQGLALTSARCVRQALEEGGEDTPVVAQRRGEERVLPGLHADRLVDATEVTAEVRAAQRDTAVQRAVTMVQRRLQDEAGPDRRVEVRARPGGTSYTAYTYRRYNDVRLAFLPESALSDFGGLDAAMTYPRQTLDAALIRVYTAQGAPLASDQHFDTTTQGVRPGDTVFSVGHPRGTRRAESADQLAVRRDLVLPNQVSVLEAWVQAVRAGDGTTAAGARPTLNETERVLKRSRARLDALKSGYLMTRLQRRDTHFQSTLQGEAALQGRFGGVLDSLKRLQTAKRNLASEYRAFGSFEAGPYTASTFRHLLRVARSEGAVGDSLSGTRWSDSVEIALLADRLRRIETFLRPDTAAVRRLLNNQTPTERAAEIVEESVLASSTGEGANASAIPSDDPAMTLLDLVGAPIRSFYDEWIRLSRAERRLTHRLAEARRAVQSEPVYGAVQRAPRGTDGRVLGYPYNGTTAPPLTTFYGLYSHRHAFEGDGAWALPQRWEQVASELNRSTPLTLAVSTDPAAGGPGAPLLNKYLEVVGVTVGTNIQALAGEYIFLPERMRTVAVDLRGLRESLRTVYGAGGLVEELAGRRSGASGVSK